MAIGSFPWHAHTLFETLLSSWFCLEEIEIKYLCIFEISRNTVVVICPFAEDFFKRYWFGFPLVRKFLLPKLVVMRLGVVGEEQEQGCSCWHCA